MSGPDPPPEPLAPTSKLKRKQFSRSDQADLDGLDRAFKRIKSAVPRAPYILSTPSMDPYRFHSQQEHDAWLMGTLWDRSEQHLQYRTFLYREPYQDCFTLQNGEDEEPTRERPRSQLSGVSLHGVAKKKISLSDYKSKQANGVITPGSKKLSPNLPATKPAAPQTNGTNKSERPSASAQKQDDKTVQKRPPPEPSLPAKPDKQSKDEPLKPSKDTAPLPQKAETSESKANVDKSGPSNATPHGLPPMLSPVDQPLSNPYGLPPILSPTLPAAIQAELDRIETQRKRAESNASTSSSDRKSQLLTVPESRPQKPDEVSKVPPRARSVSLNGKSPSNTPAKGGNPDQPSLIVKLKFSKSKQPTVKQILRLPPKRNANTDKNTPQETSGETSQAKNHSKTTEETSHKPKPIPKVAARRPDSATPNVNTVKASPASTKVAEKRPRSEDDAGSTVPNKRPRALSAQDGPITPKQQITPSPAPSAKSSAQKSQGPHLTPKKEHKAVNMLRTGSTEANDVTPGRSGSGVTPSSSRNSDLKATPTSAPPNRKKQADFELLSQTSSRLNQLGRDIKHEIPKIMASKGNKATKDDEKRAAVSGLECILAYTAAFYAQDLSSQLRNRPGEVEGTWKMLLSLADVYARNTQNFPHLDGLRLYLSTVIAATICTRVSHRAPRSRDKDKERAHDSPQDIPHSDLVRQHNQMTDNFSLLAKHCMFLLQYAQDARAALPIDEIQHHYRKTWAGAETNNKLAKEQEKPNGGRLSGPYFLPIQNDTTPIQAVRFGLRFLTEYCENEKLDHTLRVNLDNKSE